jgi:excisionase family DNA binding protein
MEVKRKTNVSATMSVDEAAAMLGVNRKTMYKLIRVNRFPALRFGRRIRVSRSAVEAALASGLWPVAAHGGVA